MKYYIYPHYTLWQLNGRDDPFQPYSKDLKVETSLCFEALNHNVLNPILLILPTRKKEETVICESVYNNE